MSESKPLLFELAIPGDVRRHSGAFKKLKKWERIRRFQTDLEVLSRISSDNLSGNLKIFPFESIKRII